MKFKAKQFKHWLDDLARATVKARDGHTCQWCKVKVSGYNCQWSHIRSRKYNNTRWQMSNAVTLCGRCHRRWHDEPLAGAEWLYTSPPKCVYDYEHVEGTWHQDDFEMVEKYLLFMAEKYGVKQEHFSQARFGNRFVKKMEGNK